MTATTTTVVIDGGTAVFDATTGRIHLLNASAERDLVEPARRRPRPVATSSRLVRAGTSLGIDDETIETTVAQLVRAGLLSDRPA